MGGISAHFFYHGMDWVSLPGLDPPGDRRYSETIKGRIKRRLARNCPP